MNINTVNQDLFDLFITWAVITPLLYKWVNIDTRGQITTKSQNIYKCLNIKIKLEIVKGKISRKKVYKQIVYLNMSGPKR